MPSTPRVSFAAITRAVVPFLIPMVVTLLLITFFLWLVLFLPRLFRRRLGGNWD